MSSSSSSSTPDEATVHTDGSATFYDDIPPTAIPVMDPEFVGDSSSSPDFLPPSTTSSEEPSQDGFFADESGSGGGKGGGIDPAIFVLVGVALILVLYYFFVLRKKAKDSDDFFTNLDGDKFNLKLPAEVDEYYQIKSKCEAAGWEPGRGPPGGQDPAKATGPHRVLAQALMKRAIADIPIVTFIQKESPGMNRLYSQSMCSVKQWRAYQAAEALVSGEVEDVRAEADEIEPGWSNVIWRQAMQYHTVLKQKHESEAKAAEEQAKKRKEVEQKVQAAKQVVDDAKARELAAEKAAQELIQMEEREKQSKKAFATGMKKGFLDGKGGKKK